jgi:hypothetical protein
MARFIDAVRADIDVEQSPKDLLRNTILSFFRYIGENRASWIVLYQQASISQMFYQQVREGREQVIDMVARLLESGTRNPEPDTDFNMTAVAVVGAGEAISTRVSRGDIDVDDAAELMINLTWRGLKGKPSDAEAAPPAKHVLATRR